MKDSNEVVQEFNELVNMTSSELEKWLKSGDSRSAGWPKEDESGESIGHDSGRKIVEILKSNPNKDPEKYSDDQIAHMRKVVSYCKRHLAQEKQMHETKSTEEVKKSKSYASLKNWGHDPLKGEDGGDEGGDEDENENEDAEADEEGDTQENDDQQTGDKRKKDTGAQSGANKKRETRQGKASTNGNKKQDDEDDNDEEEEEKEEEEEEENDEDDGGEEDDDDQEADGENDGGDSGKKSKKGPTPGDKVSWAWGNGHPEGKVLDVKEDKATVTTKRGSKVSRHGDPEDPAVVLDTGKSKAIKSNHELD